MRDLCGRCCSIKANRCRLICIWNEYSCISYKVHRIIYSCDLQADVCSEFIRLIFIFAVSAAVVINIVGVTRAIGCCSLLSLFCFH